jgi:RNA polymerase sigma-70 factor (ECF subfamily)
MTQGITLKLIHQAQAGHKEALSTFSKLARERVYVFIYRLTLDLHCTEDLTQETLLDLIKSLDRLSFTHINFFWSWLHRTALGKVQHYYRARGYKKVESLNKCDNQTKQIDMEENSGINRLIKEELKKAVCDAMRTLSLAHRSILTLRCFEQLSYPEIAAITGQSELQARVQFFRAKQSLKKRLTNKGFGRDQLLLALGLVATITERAVKKTATTITINQAMLSVSGPTVILGTLASKAGIAATIIVLAGAIAGGTHLSNGRDTPVPQPQNITLRQAYNTFANPSRVIETFTPDGTAWRAYSPPNPTTVTTVSQPMLEDILMRSPQKDLRLLFIPETCWVHLEFNGPLVDGPGIDILMDARNADQGPRLYVTDGNDQEMEISPANTQPAANGFTLTGYDLADLNIPFIPRAVRLEGCGTRANNNYLELWVVKARVEGL